jgi:hypothetical protein
MTITTRSSMVCGLAAVLAFTPAVATAQQSGRSTTKSRSGPASLGIHGFSVVLVIGAMSGTAASSSDLVPESARKALADMKDFLPYKRYQLLDAGWMLCCASNNNGASGRVRGPNERDYTYSVDPIGVSDSRLNLRFSMREVPALAGERLIHELLTDSRRTEQHPDVVRSMRELDEAVEQYNATKILNVKGLVATSELDRANLRVKSAEQRVESLKSKSRPAGTHRNVIDSTFSISLGETVVIGTSRLNGDQALIAILTAAAKPGAAR